MASMNWYVGPVSKARALSRISPARIAHASPRLAARMLSRWKKSASPGWVWILDCAAEPERFRHEWTVRVRALRFDDLNALIDRHNRWYPVESRLPMDPRRGDYALVNGRDYRLEPLDADWVLERFPAKFSSVPVSAP